MNCELELLEMKTENNTRPAPPKPSEGGPESDRRAPPLPKLTLSNPLILVLIVLLTLPWLVVGWIFVRGAPPGTLAPLIFSRPAGIIKPFAAKVVEGSWGTLEITPIIVEPPSAFFSFDFDINPSRQWAISNATPDQARELFSRAGLNRQDIDAVMKTAAPNPAQQGQIFRPPDAVVRAMSPAVRAALYSELGKNPANILQVKPYQFRGSPLSAWFAKSEVPDHIIKKIKPLVYQRGEMLCFSDLHLILPEISLPMDRIRLLRTLHRTTTLSLQLRIKEGAPLDTQMVYWGRGKRRYIIEPALQSIRNQAGGGALDVVFLLPDFARTRLYTYINPTRSDIGISRDCHWASFNFFNELPDSSYGISKGLTDMISKEFVKINSPMEFGDVIVFFRPPSEAIHSCVYIADDIVFTKNGVGFGAPFIFDHLDNIIATYRQEVGDFTMRYFRRRASND